MQRLPLSNSKSSSPNEIEVPFESKVAEKHDNPYVENSLQSSKALLHVFFVLEDFHMIADSVGELQK